MVCLLNSCLYVMFRSCFESLASVVPIKVVRATHCGAPRRALWCAAHCGTPYAHGQLREQNDWQFSNPRIDTARSTTTRWPSPRSRTCFYFPVYTWNEQQYPFVASQHSHTFIPHLVGFAGMYCSHDSLPLTPTIASSTLNSLWGT